MRNVNRTQLRGFSLFEILIVIAIIGILISVVLVSLDIARERSKEASIKGNMHSVANSMSIYFNERSTYGAPLASASYTGSGNLQFDPLSPYSFNSDSDTNQALNAAFVFSAGTWASAIGTDGATYAIAFLYPDFSGWWCIDSAGAATFEVGSTSPNLSGDTVPAVCP